MNDLEFKFIFHSIGQGLFYSGNIRDFNFIYDCGSSGIIRINDYLDDYYLKNYLQSRKLDLLVLSHLHHDHIFGVNHLLDNVNSIDTVILPYISPLERLFLIAKLRKPPNNDIYEQQLNFYANPYLSLIESENVRRVIVISGGQSSEYQKEYDETEPPDPERFYFNKRRINYDDLPESDKYEKTNFEESEEISLSNKLHLKRNGRVHFNKIWEFLFYNCKTDTILYDNFKREIINMGISKNGINAKSLKDIVSDKSKLKNIRKAYSKLHNKSINNSSIIMYHGPILCNNCTVNYHQINTDIIYTNMKIEWPFAPFCGLFVNWWPQLNRHCIAHLLTGDINLNDKYTEIKSYFGRLYDRISTILVPHHGSIKNWNNALINDLHQNQNIIERYWICSSRINSIHHPSLKVVKDIKKTVNNYYVHCNEYNRVVFQGKISIR